MKYSQPLQDGRRAILINTVEEMVTHIQESSQTEKDELQNDKTGFNNFSKYSLDMIDMNF